MHDLSLQIAAIGAAGIGAQWLAWRLQIPAIVLLLAAGIVFGPMTGFLDPQRDFGDLYRPLVQAAVAIILFEGGLTLNLREIRETSKAVRRIVIIGGPLVWLMTALSGHYVGGLSWTVSIVLGAILVVTGPTVIMPLLRQAKLKHRPASLLRWEAIINDPIGALFAVIAFEGYLVFRDLHAGEDLAGLLLASGLVAVGGGYVLARIISWSFRKGHVPDFLKAPIVFSTVIVANALTNEILDEAGLLTVTVMGIVLANSRFSSLNEMRRFKETVTVLLVSGLFILLMAALKANTILSLDMKAFAFVALLLFVVRPLAIFLATINADLSWQERLLVGWIGPRGIVAIAVASLFATNLAESGVADAEKMISYAFAVVVATIVLHGFTFGPLARILKLKSVEKPGILFVGGSRWTAAFAVKLNEIGVPTLVADRNWNRIANMRLADVEVYYGEVLSEAAHHTIMPARFDAMIAATDNDSYNALVCTDFGPEIGRARVFQIGREREGAEDRKINFTLGGEPLFKPGKDFWELESLIDQGWIFRSTKLSENYTIENYADNSSEEDHLILWIGANDSLTFGTIEDGEPGPGDIAVSFGPPRQEKKKKAERRAKAASAANGK